MKKTFASIINKKVILFGTGGAAQDFFEYWPARIEYCVDNDKKKWGTSFAGVSVYAPEKLKEEDKEETSIIVASMYFDEISPQLAEMGFENEKHFWSIKALQTKTWGAIFPPGHYYSLLPSSEDINRYEERLAKPLPSSLPGIDLNEGRQRNVFEQISVFYKNQPFTDENREGLRFSMDNDSFGYGDAIVLHCMLRYLRPKRVIEVGSGFTSALMLDTNEMFVNNDIEFTFIEPYPNRLLSLLREGDRERTKIISSRLQEVDIEEFSRLEAGDILFIDSTHVSKVESDVNYILFEILPVLKKGVYIHFHDILYPFEYPLKWLQDGRIWNEAYVLRAFLQYNQCFEMVFWNDFFSSFYYEEMESKMPLCLKNPGGSIWLEKVEAGCSTNE